MRLVAETPNEMLSYSNDFLFGINMKLKDLEVFVVGNKPPFIGGKYFQFVKLTTKCGVIGYGECYAASVGPSTMTSIIKDVFERYLLDEDPRNIELMFRKVYSSGFSQRPDPTVIGAFSGMEIACWDIIGKSYDQPIYKLLGGQVNECLRSYSYLYPNDAEDPATFYSDPIASAAVAEKYVALGFTAVKFDPAGPYTIFDGHQPSMFDLERSERFCKEIRNAVGYKADLLFGTHGQFTTSGACRLARKIEPYDPLWFEEPIPPDNPEEMAKVAKSTKIPIATGERLTTKQEFSQVLKFGAANILQPALGRVGGIWEAKKIAVLAETYNASMAPHLYAGPLEWAANIHFGASIPNLLIIESIKTGEGFQRDLITKEILWEDGFIKPPEGPGLGIELNEVVAKSNPYKLDKLHLEMSEEMIMYNKENKFAGG